MKFLPQKSTTFRATAGLFLAVSMTHARMQPVYWMCCSGLICPSLEAMSALMAALPPLVLI